jgi:hypothetical protein
MPEFHFRHSGTNGVPQTHGVTASDEKDAFRKKDEFVAKNGVKYVPKSMEVFQQTMWVKIPDPVSSKRNVPVDAFSAAEAALSDNNAFFG